MEADTAGHADAIGNVNMANARITHAGVTAETEHATQMNPHKTAHQTAQEPTDYST
jgi:hypothetical protein